MNGRARVIIENVQPAVDGGRFPIKRVQGESVQVEADAFTDGHDRVTCRLLFRREDETDWHTAVMEAAGNDRWVAAFEVDAPGRYCYTLTAWVDHFETWWQDLCKRRDAEQDLSVEFLRGAAMVTEAAGRAPEAVAAELRKHAARLADVNASAEKRFEVAGDGGLAALMDAYPDPALITRVEREFGVVVDRVRARYSTWYELFPRSTATEPGVHGTLRDCEARLPYVARMGFDVLYLPPIHPIGVANRKGANNAVTARPGEPGSPWAIGAAEGGHKGVHPHLGTIADLKRLRARAEELGIELALDLAFQCSPDHPYVREHRNWFLERPDGTIQYAENPPKKYQDIVPFYFETSAWPELWRELLDVVRFWMAQGIRIFRVDNPHTKPFDFWEWLIGEVKREQPDVIFLSEAFTRPKVMHRLAKVGFTQSYTYFAWRNTKYELTQYLTELTQSPGREYLRPNLWPNTPDILTEYLQYGGRAAFMVRLVLAATLGASYGIYGPTFELLEHEAREPGSEEYKDSEKYQIRHWDLNRSDSLQDFIARVNQIRRENRALHSDWTLQFHPVDNDAIICYSKTWDDERNGEKTNPSRISEPDISGKGNFIVVVVNLDPHHAQSGWLELPLEELGFEAAGAFQAHDLLSGARFLWQGPRNFIALDPASAPAHILRLRRRVRSERDFDYFL
ncbi:MAG: alpha-1,4-glucan--maltose-1-phosphate maltosyltransferase [Proteobacteria bacterium]|nr:MAG: alpha-1,4-glucan--maltose-1-phosphate maltosyltransferase [Pseudomonadota bacterium]